MELFFSENLNDGDNEVRLSADESRHLLRALRKKSGEHIRITNGCGLLVEAEIGDNDRANVLCRILSNRMLPPPPERNIHIALSTIRPNRMDWAVEKLTELGVGSISAFHSQYCSVKSFKPEHLRKIAISAIKQSGQAYLPEIYAPLPFSDWIEKSPSNNSLNLIAHNGDTSLTMSQIGSRNLSEVQIAIGPEGGFSEDEIMMAMENGFQMLKLDNHTLRSETAAVAAVVQVKLLVSDMKG